MKAIVKGGPLLCFSVFSLAIRPDRPERGDREDTRVAEQFYAADSSSVSPLIYSETISSAWAITFQRCRLWFYLRLTPIVDVAWTCRFFWSSEGACG